MVKWRPRPSAESLRSRSGIFDPSPACSTQATRHLDRWVSWVVQILPRGSSYSTRRPSFPATTVLRKATGSVGRLVPGSVRAATRCVLQTPQGDLPGRSAFSHWRIGSVPSRITRTRLREKRSVFPHILGEWPSSSPPKAHLRPRMEATRQARTPVYRGLIRGEKKVEFFSLTAVCAAVF